MKSKRAAAALANREIPSAAEGRNERRQIKKMIANTNSQSQTQQFAWRRNRSQVFTKCIAGADAGKTWSEPIVLRNDGGGRDLGYPRTVQRPDGKVVAIYYFWDQKTGPERYIAASIWDPRAPENSR